MQTGSSRPRKIKKGKAGSYIISDDEKRLAEQYYYSGKNTIWIGEKMNMSRGLVFNLVNKGKWREKMMSQGIPIPKEPPIKTQLTRGEIKKMVDLLLDGKTYAYVTQNTGICKESIAKYVNLMNLRPLMFLKRRNEHLDAKSKMAETTVFKRKARFREFKRLFKRFNDIHIMLKKLVKEMESETLIFDRAPDISDIKIEKIEAKNAKARAKILNIDGNYESPVPSPSSS